MLHDVTKDLYNGIPVWPGDVEFERNTVSIGDFSSSSVRMSLHTGTHMDAPRHRFENGRTVDRIIPLIVPALVNVPGNCRGKAVLSHGPLTAPEARKLVDEGAVLFGTASTSIDPPDCFQAHEIILGAGIPIIENLVLDGIQPGEYILLAFPLKFRDADGSPVRVLLADSEEDLLKGCGGDILNR